MCAAKTVRPSNEYLLPNTRPEAGTRLALLSAIFDPASEAALARTGVGPGWRCWEVGAGEGSLARWLIARVGTHGSVVATDLDPSLTDSCPGLNVHRHDVVVDAPPGDHFDLVHTRLLLCHLAEREAVVDRLIGALKPGGWLVVEDFDGVSMPPDNQYGLQETPLATHAALQALFRSRGVEARTGRWLSAMMRVRGMTDIHAEGRMFMALERTIYARLHQLTVEQVKRDLLTAGLLTEGEYTAAMIALDRNFLAPTPILWSVVARRPAASREHEEVPR
jgi:SAM-dependent methyltransferase